MGAATTGIRGIAGALAAVVVLAATACTGGSDQPIAIAVDAPIALADQAVHIRVTGLDPGHPVTIRAEATDQAGASWHGEATYEADPQGTVELDRAKATTGTYTGVDGMGLFWSMVPADGDPDTAFFRPRFPEIESAFQVRLTASEPGRPPARTEVTREWYPNEVTHRSLTVGPDGVAGELFLPPAGTSTHPAILLFGGSEGGVSGRYDAALFAAHGYPALALGYFNLPGLPATLNDVPLEYFLRAAGILARQPGVDAGHIIAMGYSRGTEAALLLAQNFPDVIHGAVVYSPSAVVNIGFPWGNSGWTLAGVELTAGRPIPVDRISGPVLAIAGDDDRIWGSADWAEQIDQALTAAHHPYQHQALVYAGSGHLVGTFPFLASGTRTKHPVNAVAINFGGSRAADEAAQRDGWPKVLALIAGTG